MQENINIDTTQTQTNLIFRRVSDPALELATLPTNSNGMSANVDISMITFECDDLSTYLPTSPTYILVLLRRDFAVTLVSYLRFVHPHPPFDRAVAQ